VYKRYKVVLELPEVDYDLSGNWKSSVTPQDSDEAIESEEDIELQAGSKFTDKCVRNCGDLTF